MYTTRTLENCIRKTARQLPVLLVTGARQVGKTTFLKHLCEPQRQYISLDDPIVLDLARRDPALFMQRFRAPVLIDEIQYAPQLLPYIKMAVDRDRRPGMFWLTGSQQFQLMKGVSESLAGRVAVLRLLGLSRREALGQGKTVKPFLPLEPPTRKLSEPSPPAGLREIFRAIWRGSFPAIALEDLDHHIFYGSYVQTYLQRDIRDLARVGDELSFLRFVRAAAARTSQLLNLAELARDADIAPNTARNWLSILEASSLVYLLEPYHTNLTKRLVKRPKLYFLDTGLCSYLTEWSNPETLEAGAMSGAIFESWVMGELLKSYWHNGLRAPFYYYRDKDQKEIDLLIERDGRLYPVEIKKTATPRKEDVGFNILERLKKPIGHGGLICLAEQSLPITPAAVSIPVGEI